MVSFLLLGDSTPDTSFLRRVVEVLPDKYTDHLINFFVVHPTVLSRVFMWFFTSLKGDFFERKSYCLAYLHRLRFA